MATYYNHSAEEVRVFIPDERMTRVGRVRDRRTGKIQEETRWKTCEGFGSIELRLSPDVVAKKAPQLKDHPPEEQGTYDKEAAAQAAVDHKQKFLALKKADCISLCEYLQVDIVTNVEKLRESGASRSTGGATKSELAELLVRFENRFGSKKIDDALATISQSGSRRLSDDDTGE